MKYASLIILIALIPLRSFAKPLEKSKHDPTAEKPMIPGTQVPLEEMNTSPNPAPSENHSEEFRGTLKGKKKEVQRPSKTKGQN